ncbi:glycosyltransferase family A protein [uncultured Pseudodesulfovibrio sp.]|uniref:glycosyltransferase family A protein n=1 Tax=uncultured Pseudodesulfovibrio sp. TaxID=2035858 RepID=UPI0029C8EA44|nr:glycosyltransferase family A protein [uncultured Pseudodesulfovibrio sp.]
MSLATTNEFMAMATVGRGHLIASAQSAFRAAEAGDQGGVTLGARLLAMAWAEFPADGLLAAQVVRLAGVVPTMGGLMPPDGARLAARVAQEDGGGNLAEIDRLFSMGEFEDMARCLEAAASQGPVLPVVRQALHFQGILSQFEWLEGFLQTVCAPVEPELAEVFLAGVLLAGGHFDRAAAIYGRIVTRYGLPLWGMRFAASLAGAGRTERAMDVLAAVLKDFPEHTTALLTLDALAFPPEPGARLEGGCAVSIYSYNKADELRRTLDSVLASDLGPEVGEVTVRVLVNGSSDDSLAVAEAARDRYTGRMEVISLPVNVGAPAARNWLMDAALRDGERWIVYLDDDVLVRSDWLAGLAAGVRDFPGAGVWGCRVADVRSPGLTQHGDGFLLPPDEAARRGDGLVLEEPCVEVMAEPLLRYRRYAASVTGCCHLFETASLAGSGGFDLLFSPSQCDDLDLDLRRLAQGLPAAYLGDVRITHLRESTHFLKLSEGAAAQSRMHRLQLEERHGPGLEALCATQRAVIRADLEARRERLQRAGLLPVSS